MTPNSRAYITQFIQPDSIIPDPYNALDWNRYLYARGNPIKYSDPSGHAVKGDVEGNGCSGQGPACILEMFGYDSEASDDAIERYIERNPDYNPITDPELEGVNVSIVAAAKLRVECWAGSFASCATIYGISSASSYAMFGMGPSGPIGETPGYNKQFVKDAIGDPDCPGCGYVGLSRNINSTSQLDVNMLDRLQYDGTVSGGGRSGGNRPLYGSPNSYVNTSGGHTLVYDGSGRLIYDIDANRVKMVVWDHAPYGLAPRDVKLKGSVPPNLIP